MQGPARDDAAACDRFLAIMADQTHRMGRLVNDLLSLSRIELDEHNRPAERVDMADMIHQTIEILEPVASERRVRIEMDVPDGLQPVTGDSDQVLQVLRNLIENAIKYGREGGTVRVIASVEGATLGVAVQDDGEGIPREHLHRLTERFYRVDAARSRKAGGTGLGLAIVKHIVNRHRGRLHIQSEPGQGSRFTVYWPLSRIK
jgi:two-component system phosphate regulon sensor histidine kinase PhoR